MNRAYYSVATSGDGRKTIIAFGVVYISMFDY